MLQIMCLVTSEDYWYLDSLVEKNIPINFYGYMFEVEGAGEGSGGGGVVRLMVVELINANIAVGFALPKGFSVDGDFQLKFQSQELPSKEIPVVCRLSQEVKRTSYVGDENQRLEFIGFSLEKFYESKGATFYLYDLRGARQPG